MRADYRVVLDACVETPRLYLPKWTQAIMDEVTLPEAWVEGVEPLVDAMTNDAKDRRILASVQAWELDVQGPSTFPARPL
jgi:hypothetical protein